MQLNTQNCTIMAIDVSPHSHFHSASKLLHPDWLQLLSYWLSSRGLLLQVASSLYTKLCLSLGPAHESPMNSSDQLHGDSRICTCMLSGNASAWAVRKAAQRMCIPENAISSPAAWLAGARLLSLSLSLCLRLVHARLMSTH